MSGLRSASRSESATAEISLGQVEAMARMARETNLIVHVVVARVPGAVGRARQVARDVGVECFTDLRAHTVRVRFGPASDAAQP